MHFAFIFIQMLSYELTYQIQMFDSASSQAWQKYPGTRPVILGSGYEFTSGLPESQCKQIRFMMLSVILHQFMINKQINDKQISEKLDFSVCLFMVLVHLTFRYARVSTNFVSILFLPLKSLISVQAQVMRVPARKLHTRPRYINTHISPGQLAPSFHL